MWLYGFVHLAEGETYWWIQPCVNTSVFNRVLAEFAAFYGRGKNQLILLRLDSAGWHTSNDLVLPEGIDLIELPADSP